MATPPPDPEALLERVIHAGQRLPPGVREAVLEAGAAVVPGLVRVLEDEALATQDAPGEGFAPIHAARLLRELRAPEAIEPMLRALVKCDVMDILFSELATGLPDFGAAAFEPAWALYTRTEDPEARTSLRSVMAELGVRDERLYRELLAELETAPDRAAMSLAQYGDSAALPHLERAFRAYRLDEREGNILGNQTLIELRAAIEELGGELTPEMEAKFERGDAVRRAAFGRIEQALAAPAKRAGKVGRNDPCPCGSGKKYKKCCLGKG